MASRRVRRLNGSGGTQSYEERLASGRTPVYVWLGPEAQEVLESLMVARGVSRRVIIEEALLSLGGSGPKKVSRSAETAIPPPETSTPRLRRRRPRQPVYAPGSVGDLMEQAKRSAGTRAHAVEVATGEDVSNDE